MQGAGCRTNAVGISLKGLSVALMAFLVELVADLFSDISLSGMSLMAITLPCSPLSTLRVSIHVRKTTLSSDVCVAPGLPAAYRHRECPLALAVAGQITAG